MLYHINIIAEFFIHHSKTITHIHFPTRHSSWMLYTPWRTLSSLSSSTLLDKTPCAAASPLLTHLIKPHIFRTSTCFIYHMHLTFSHQHWHWLIVLNNIPHDKTPHWGRMTTVVNHVMKMFPHTHQQWWKLLSKGPTAVTKVMKSLLEVDHQHWTMLLDVSNWSHSSQSSKNFLRSQPRLFQLNGGRVSLSKRQLLLWLKI